MSNLETAQSIMTAKKRNQFISKPLLNQTMKANWVLWLIMTLGSVFIFIIVNMVIGTRNIFTNIDMGAVTKYVEQEDMSWLQILGLLEKMGFKLDRIQVMSQIDLNIVVNDLIYRIAGVLLPMVYVMIVSNKLIASQVSDGSMAYVLSTPTNRRLVIRTQLFFMTLSLILMYAIITVAVLGSEYVANIIKMANYPNSTSNLLPLRSLLYCLASFMAMFGLMGICFGASAFFNKSSNSIAVGGGVCIFSFICCILGLFGNKVFVAVGVGVQAMNIFNYMTLFTLIDTDSMSAFAKHIADPVKYATTSTNWIWELAILFVIGVVFIIIGSERFVRKDLPL